VQRRSAGRR